MSRLKRSIPNIITLSRPLLACAFAALLPGFFGGIRSAALPLAVFAAICLSDFLDGRAARALGAVSMIGARLDLYSDFLYIGVSLVTLNVLGQAPVWFTAVVIAKFIEYLITSRILGRGREGVYIHDPFGRIAAGMFFIMPGLACALYWIQWRGAVFCAVLYLAAALALVSSVIRCISCVGKSTDGIAAQK